MSRCAQFTAVLAGLLLAFAPLLAADEPTVTESNFVLRDFHFRSGEALPELRMHYRTLGKPQRDERGVVRNAVLIMHGTTGSSAGFIRKEFSGTLFGSGQPLDAEKFYLILPDALGHGDSAKPSDGLHARFPAYGYADMVEADHRLLVEGLKVDHLRLVMGTSMGGMHTWVWGETYPDFMDALLPLASLPAQISGRNRMWRKMMSESIRTDPEWLNGDYKQQPRGLRFAAEMLAFVSSNPLKRYQEAPTPQAADELLERQASHATATMDANDVLYAVEASRDYDPGPKLESIRAPLLAINFADDLINPPDLGILEREIKRVKGGRAILIPEGDQTNGHGTHTLAGVWKEHLEALLKATERS